MAVLALLLSKLTIAALYAAALIGAGFGLATILQRWFGRDHEDDAIDWGTAFCLGLGLYGPFWIILGLAGLLRLPLVLAALAPGWLCCAYRVGAFVRRADYLGVRTRARTMVGRLDFFACVLVLTLLIEVGLLFAGALIEPHGDALAFYLAWPKVIAASGLIRPLTGYEGFSNIWMLSEVHFAAVMIVGEDLAARYFPLLCLAAAARLLWELAETCGCGLWGKPLAVTVLVTSMAAINVSHDGKTDMIAVAPSLAAALWTLRLGGERNNAALVYAGVCCGVSVGAKLSYIPPLGAAIALLILMRAGVPRPTWWRSTGQALKWALVIGFIAFVVTIPNLVKNFMLFGDPVLPFSTGQGLRDVWFSPAVQWRILLTFPFALTFGDYWAQQGTLSPLILGLLPLLLFWAPDRSEETGRNLRCVGWAAVGALAAWVLSAPSQLAPRYFLGPALLLGVVVAWAGEQGWRRGGAALRLGVPLFSIAVAALVAWEVSYRARRALNLEGPVYVNRSLTNCAPEAGSICQIAMFVNANVEPGARIALFSYFRYFFRADLLQCLVALPQNFSEEFMLKGGADYIIIDAKNWPWPAGVPVPNSQIAELVYSVAPYSLYRVKPRSESDRPKLTCVMMGPGRWSLQ